MTTDYASDRECGVGGFKPKCLQSCVHIGAFIGVYTISGLLTSTLSVYINSQVPTLEKTFGFSSAKTGFLMACNDIGFLSMVIFTGYLAKKVHIPRGLVVSTMLYGVCGLLCALPYFLQDRSIYKLDWLTNVADITTNKSETRTFGKEIPMCDNKNVSDSSGDECLLSNEEGVEALQQLSTNKMAYTLIAIGMVLQGIGKAPRFPFLTLFIDDSVSQQKTGFYIGVIFSTAIFGPVLAYLAGGLFSRIYVTLESVPISPTDPRWTGAWWLGFLVFGSCSIVFSIPIWCFPRNIRSKSRQKELENKKETAKLQGNQETMKEKEMDDIKGYVMSYGRLCKNPAYCFLTMSSMIGILGVSGTMSFYPKYVALQYNLPLWKANMLFACFSILAVSIGSFVGGVISRRVKMTPLTTCKMVIAFYSVRMVTLIAGFFLGCDQPVLYGGNNLSSPSPLYKMTESPCNVGCSCDEYSYFPICGDDGRSYFSPCHAGCSTKDITAFSNCTCIETGHASAGLCDQGCTDRLYIYAPMMFVGKLFTAFNIIPTYVAKLRSVEQRDRAVGTATQGFLLSAMGWVPGPVIFGAIIDNTCSLWKYTCGERQSCSMYDIEYFRIVLHAYGLITLAISTLLIGCVYLYFKAIGQNKWKGEENEKLPRKDANDDIEMKNGLKD